MAILACSCEKSPSYFVIAHQSQGYYRELADSCDKLLLRTKPSPDFIVLKGDDATLPAALLKLHAAKVVIAKHAVVGTNYLTHVEIVFGATRPEYVIWWAHTDYGGGIRPWQLTISGGGSGKLLFSTNQVSQYNPIPTKA
jgi:hypothetical protein